MGNELFYSKYVSKSYKYILTNKKEEDKYHVLQGKSDQYLFFVVTPKVQEGFE